MKNIVFLSLLVILANFSATAQPGERKEKMEAFRVAFFTEKLNLTPEEAKNFWPIMDEYRDARQKLHGQLYDDKDIDSMTDAEVEQFINRSVEFDQKELDLKKDFLFKMRKVLPARKVARLQGIERDFKEELLKKIRKQAARNEGGGPAPGPGGRRRNR